MGTAPGVPALSPADGSGSRIPGPACHHRRWHGKGRGGVLHCQLGCPAQDRLAAALCVLFLPLLLLPLPLLLPLLLLLLVLLLPPSDSYVPTFAFAAADGNLFAVASKWSPPMFGAPYFLMAGLMVVTQGLLSLLGKGEFED
jgi:hypothetical protein